MIQLILKDFYIMKKVSMWLMAWAVILFLKDSPPFGLIAALISVVFIRQTLVLDDKYKMNPLFCSLPLKRSTIVLARYTSVLITIVMTTVLVFFVSLILQKNIMTFREASMVVFYVITFFSVFLPFYFRFGSQLRSELGYISLAISILLFLILLIGSALYAIDNISVFEIPGIYTYLALALIIFVSVSVIMSIRIFKKRDL